MQEVKISFILKPTEVQRDPIKNTLNDYEGKLERERRRRRRKQHPGGIRTLDIGISWLALCHRCQLGELTPHSD